MDTTDNRLITFRLPTELDEGALALEPLEGDSTYGFMFGFISPKTGRKINFSITHPNKDTLEVAPDYLGGDKIDFSWKQARDVDGGYKYNPQGWKWAHQLTFWIKASEIGGTVPVEKNPVADMPTKYELAQNYPNPFNPSTTITFSLPNPSEVRLTIFDITGRIVKELVDKRCETGVHNISWDATDNYGMPVASGTYYYRFEADDHVYTKKMMFIK
jgi:hypothetical protein